MSLVGSNRSSSVDPLSEDRGGPMIQVNPQYLSQEWPHPQKARKDLTRFSPG